MNNIKKLAYYAVPTILGSAVISSLYHQYNDKSQSFAEHLKENVNWIFDRVPNARENFILRDPELDRVPNGRRNQVVFL